MAIIVRNKLHIEQLKLCFKSEETFRTPDILSFYRSIEPDVNQSTVNWRIYSLVQKGILNRIGRGKFKLGNKRNFLPEVTKRLKTINRKLRKEFPFLEICLWNTSVINEFMNHQPGRYYILVEVEKDAVQSVFFFLKDNKFPVFIEPTSDLIERYLPDLKESLIVTSLVTEAPLQYLEGVTTVTIEKLLVDIFSDKVIFSSQQGSEMTIIFNEALNKYTVNENRMLRYADRRGRKESFQKYLNSLSIFRQ